MITAGTLLRKKMVILNFLLVATVSFTSCKKENYNTSAQPIVPNATPFRATISSPKGYPVIFSYKPVMPIKLVGQSNITISGDSIEGISTACISLIRCSNIHIIHCKLLNSSSFALYLENCSNILIDSNYIANVRTGVFAINSTTGGIRVIHNQMKNMKGPYPQASFVQFDRVSGGNNSISDNKLENFPGQSNPEDAINLYMSNGLPGSPILVQNNWIRGGGPSTSGAGITAGDKGGSYQVIENNIVVNSGAGGIQVAGGNHIRITHNTIYGKSLPWSAFGLASSNYSGTPSDNNTVAFNQVNWIAGRLKGMRRDTVYKPGTGSNINALPDGWKTNIVNAPIDSTALPLTIIDVK